MIWDAAWRETLLQNMGPAGVALAVFTNSYSPTDNRLYVSEVDGTLVSFSYDQTSQLISEARSGTYAYNRSYVWDALGNRLQQYDSGALTSGQFNAANELLTIVPPSGASTTISWDANGNLIVSNTGGALTTYSWSAENKLLNTAFSNGTSESYLYSQDGVRKTNYSSIWGGLASQYRGGASSFYGFDSQYSTRVLVPVGSIVVLSGSIRRHNPQLVSKYIAD